MKVTKQHITQLTKCYCLSELERDGRKDYLVASEKDFACLLLDEDGKVLEKVWDGPGGVMTIEPLPGGSGTFLSTRRFYSPNDSAQASIILAEPGPEDWKTRRLCSLPFVHRFGLLEREGRRYVIAATLKSAHGYKDDWTCPGRIWVGELPEDLRVEGDDRELTLTPLVSGLYRNHGFFKRREDGMDVAYIGAENGVYRVCPPKPGEGWTAERVLDTPASDMLLADLDGDGEAELLVFSPFHGDRITIYRRGSEGYAPAAFFERPLPFLHALATCRVGGREVAVVGYRKAERELLLCDYDQDRYRWQVLDRDVGPANVLCRERDGKLWVLAANRETDEVASYTVEL